MGMCAITFCTPCFCIAGCGTVGCCMAPQGQCCCCVDPKLEDRLLRLKVERFRRLQIWELSIGLFLAIIGWTFFIIVYSRCAELNSLSSGECWSTAGGQEWDTSAGSGFWAAVGVGIGTPLTIHAAIGLLITAQRLQKLQERQATRWKEVPGAPAPVLDVA